MPIGFCQRAPAGLQRVAKRFKLNFGFLVRSGDVFWNALENLADGDVADLAKKGKQARTPHAMHRHNNSVLAGKR